MPTKPKKSSPKKKARTFAQDLMKGEHTVGETASLKGGLVYGMTIDPYSNAGGQTSEAGAGTSIFDPVLCELAYRWFVPPAGAILDPFAGGSVRGIVAAKLGRHYTGIDLSLRQIEANRLQAEDICPDLKPTWIHGDSVSVEAIAPGEYDFIFSCPPYGDLEVYSDDPADLSVMEAEQFRVAYERIIGACVRMLNPDRFACFVVGDYRGADGFYQNLPGLTIAAFEGNGARLYNEAILLTAIGSLPIRVGRQFEATRKLGKTHQNVLVFCNGDPKKAAEAVGMVEFGAPEDVVDSPTLSTPHVREGE